VKARLQRRAELHQSSLEADVRDIPAQVPEPKRSEPSSEGVGSMFASLFAQDPIPDQEWDIFERGIAEARALWRLRDLNFQE
jgi:hypothetical protein